MAVALIVFAWIPAILIADSARSPIGHAGQWVLGVLTWALLLWLLRREAPEDRLRVSLQVGIVVVFATVIEYVFSAWLGTYEYRLGGVPAYVPPGHGLIYLGALGFGRSGAVARHRRAVVAGTVVAATALAVNGLVSERPDALGAFWCLCLFAFLAFGRSTLVYVGAFVMVTWLEYLGTALGVWTWAEVDPILGVVTMGNPPSVAAGGYGWFDLAAISFAPWLASRLVRSTSSAAECSSPLVVTAPGPDRGSEPV